MCPQEHVSAQGVEHPGLVALMHFADKNKHAASLLLPPPPADDLRQPEGDEPAFKVRPRPTPPDLARPRPTSPDLARPRPTSPRRL